MAMSLCKILGIMLIVIGLIGFMAPGLLGMHLTALHNVVHLISGGVAVLLGTKSTYAIARKFCIGFGAFYFLLGASGFLAGPGNPSVPDLNYDPNLLKLIPGHLEMGIMDSLVHILLGILFMIGGLVPERPSTLIKNQQLRQRAKSIR